MHVHEAIRARRSIKRFDPEQRLPREHVDQLLDLALLAPTAFNIQHCRLVEVQDPQLRRELRAASFDQRQVTDAGLLVAVCADVQAWRRQPQRYWHHVPESVQASLVSMIEGFYAGREQMQRDEALRSCGLVAQTLMLAAEGLGYGSCPMDGFDFDRVGELLRLPPDHLVSMFVAIGTPLQPAHPRGGRIPRAEAILRDRFPAPGPPAGENTGT